VIVLEVEEI